MVNTILPLVLAFGGPTEIQRVEVNESPAATSVLAYDDTDELAAEIIVRRTDDGEVMLDALFPDGLYMSVVTDGDHVTIDSDDAEEVAARISEIQAALPPDSTLAKIPKWAMCAGKAVFAAASCSSGGLIWCAGSTLYAACECIEWVSKGEKSCTE